MIHHPWLLMLTLALLAIAITAAMIILTVGHQSEERRPGHLDLTGIKPRRGYEWPSGSRVRAEAEPHALPIVVDERMPRGRAALVGPDGLEAMLHLDEHEHELVARVARAGGVHGTGDHAA